MPDFQNFRNAVLEDDDLQEQVISIVNTVTFVSLTLFDLHPSFNPPGSNQVQSNPAL
jgi:hypothetical protein